MPPAQHKPRQFRNNYTGSTVKSLRDVLRWQWQRFRHGLPAKAELPTPTVAADLERIHANANAGAWMVPSVTWIGHATALVQADGLNVLTDPVFSPRVSPVRFAGPRRAQPPGVAQGDLPRIDVVLISHNHYDHLDRDSIRSLARQPGGGPVFLVPLGIAAWLRRLGIGGAIELDWWEAYTVGHTQFHFTPAQHWSGRTLTDRNKTLWGAWSALGTDCHWFFSGDTGYSRDFIDTRRHFSARQTAELGGGFDVALIAVGACEPRWFMQQQHVDPREAVQIHLDLAAKRSVGVHWGTFQLSDEALDHPLHTLAGARDGLGVADDAFRLLAIGETLILPARRRSSTDG